MARPFGPPEELKFTQPFYNETNMVLSRLELETYSYQKYTLPIKLKNRSPSSLVV
jgi:hypothetical protein